MRKIVLICVGMLVLARSEAQVKILFDNTKAETAGNADWVIDADNHNMDWNPTGCTSCGGNEANPQQTPTPAQSGITSSTAETYWTGALSNWGVDCAKQGYVVESLSYNKPITYGNTSNTQDLSHYSIYIVDEPNILFTAAQKTAIMNFLINGGSLFMISDHTVSDRNNDGYDSPDIWNDFISNNGVMNNGFGFSVDLQNFSQTSSNVIASSLDSIIHGPFGNVTQVQWSNGTSMTLNPTQNSSVRGVIYKTGSSGNSGVLCAYARVGCGKVAIIGDSSPPDDGTGDPNDVLYNGYIQDAAGNHQKLLMNIVIWLAQSKCNTDVRKISDDHLAVWPNPASNEVCVRGNAQEVKIYDLTGAEHSVEFVHAAETTLVQIHNLRAGIYFMKVIANGKAFTEKLVVSP